MHKPKVSWLLCAHILNPDLYAALLSCINQTFSDFEVIVVANGPDNEKIANQVGLWFENDLRVRIFKTEISFLSFSLSLGLHYARADLIA